MHKDKELMEEAMELYCREMGIAIGQDSSGWDEPSHLLRINIIGLMVEFYKLRSKWEK